jgi:hypothetical protein
MALKDDKTLTTVTQDNWTLLLEGEGIITNMGTCKSDLQFRFDIAIPDINDAYRLIEGISTKAKNSFVNEDNESKIYGRASIGSLEVLITRAV